MDIKRVSIGTLVGLIVLYALGFVFWEMLFADFFAANSGTATGVEREAPILWALILGTLIYAELITLALESRGATSLVDAAMVGAVVGIGVWGTADLIIFSITNLNTLTGAIADIVLEGVRAGIAGAVIAVVLSKLGSGQASQAG